MNDKEKPHYWIIAIVILSTIAFIGTYSYSSNSECAARNSTCPVVDCIPSDPNVDFAPEITETNVEITETKTTETKENIDTKPNENIDTKPKEKIETKVTEACNCPEPPKLCKQPLHRNKLDEFFKSDCTDYRNAIIILSQQNGWNSEYKFPVPLNAQKMKMFLQQAKQLNEENLSEKIRSFIFAKKEGEKVIMVTDGAEYIYYAPPSGIITITQIDQTIQDGLDSKTVNFYTNVRDGIWKQLLKKNDTVLIGTNEKETKYLKINNIHLFQGEIKEFNLSNPKHLKQIKIEDEEFLSDALDIVASNDTGLFSTLVNNSGLQQHKVNFEKKKYYTDETFFKSLVPTNVVLPKKAVKMAIQKVGKSITTVIQHLPDGSMTNDFKHLLSLTKTTYEDMDCSSDNLLLRFLKNYIEIEKVDKFCGYVNRKLECDGKEDFEKKCKN